jgi:spoIIIJ-associated protein
MTQVDITQLQSGIEGFVNDLIDKSSLDLRAEIKQIDETTIVVSFQGFDLPLLLGHNAELLDALQYIARRAFAESVAAGAQIDFDAGGYRTQRRQELELMAQKAADRVRISKVAFVFDPMNAQDRRIIHLALMEEGGVRTESEGDGQMRRVKILPA